MTKNELEPISPAEAKAMYLEPRKQGWGPTISVKGVASTMVDASTGAPEGNQHAQTHALNADPHHYHQSLPSEEKEYVRDVAASIEDRIRRNTGDVDYLDRVMARRIAIELHIVSKATDYVENVSGLTETIFTGHGSHEKKAALLGEIRKRDNRFSRYSRNWAFWTPREPEIRCTRNMEMLC